MWKRMLWGGGMKGNKGVKTGELSGRTILVVEDEPLIALDLKTALEDAGAKVIQAADAASALPLAERRDLSAAIVDFWLGSDSGGGGEGNHRHAGNASAGKTRPELML
jgi:DNA-binding NarL/FixJ family response regulator